MCSLDHAEDVSSVHINTSQSKGLVQDYVFLVPVYTLSAWLPEICLIHFSTAILYFVVQFCEHKCVEVCRGVDIKFFL